MTNYIYFVINNTFVIFLLFVSSDTAVLLVYCSLFKKKIFLILIKFSISLSLPYKIECNYNYYNKMYTFINLYTYLFIIVSIFLSLFSFLSCSGDLCT